MQKADLKEQVETMICQLGTQNLLMSSHWDSSTKDVMIKFKVKLSNVELELKDKSKQLISTINELMLSWKTMKKPLRCYPLFKKKIKSFNNYKTGLEQVKQYMKICEQCTKCTHRCTQNFLPI